MFDHEAGWGVLLDDGEGAVALRTEGLHGGRVEHRAVTAEPDGKVGDDVAVFGGENDHVVLVAAGGEENLVFDIEGETRTAAPVTGNVVLPDHLHVGCVDHSNGVLVLKVDVDTPLAVRHGLFGRSAEIDGAEDRAVLGIEHRDVRSGVGQDVEAVIERVVQIAVGIALDVNFLDGRESLRVEHGDRLRGGEAVSAGCVHCRAVGADACDVADLRERIDVVDADVARRPRASDVQVAIHGIGGDVIEAALPADLYGAKNFVGTGGLLGGSGQREDKRECSDDERSGRHTVLLIGTRGRAFVVSSDEIGEPS